MEGGRQSVGDTAARGGEAALEVTGKLLDKINRYAHEAYKCAQKTSGKGAKKWNQTRRNHEAGKAWESGVNRALKEEGYELVGENVTLKGIDNARRRADGLFKKDGNLIQVESKLNSGKRTTTQITKDAALSTSGGTPIGKNAPEGVRDIQIDRIGTLVVTGSWSPPR